MDESQTSFLSYEDKMVARAPILEGGMRKVTFKKDMMKVWVLIYMIMRYLDCWTYVKSVQRKRYGKKAYRALWDHFFLPDNIDNMTSESERILVATHYSGERKRVKF